MPDFTDADLISFAARYYRAAGAREAAIKLEFGLTATRYYQAVNAVLDDPARIQALPRKLWPVVRRLDEQRQRAVQLRRPIAG